MGKQWARQQAKKNEIATAIEGTTAWIQAHQQATVWIVVGCVAAILIGGAFYNKFSDEREETWSRYWIAQSYAYNQQSANALAQIKKLAEENPAAIASSYGVLLGGDVLFEQGRFEEAAQAYKKVMTQPNHESVRPIAMANLSLTKEAAGDCKGGNANSQEFLDAYADHFLAPQVHASFARCLGALGQAEQARATYERMAFLYPDTYWANWAKDRLKG